MTEQMRPRLMRRDPEAWAEVLHVCEVAANAGHLPIVASNHLRHLDVTHGALMTWIKAGIIPAYRPDNRRPRGDISHLL